MNLNSVIIHFGNANFRRIKQGRLTDNQFNLIINNSYAFGATGIYSDCPKEEFKQIFVDGFITDEIFDGIKTFELLK